MRRLLLSLAIMIIVAINANAQFERGTWYVNTSMSGMGISHSTYEGTNIGVGLSAGSFIDDNVALLVSTRGNYYDKGLDQFSIGTQCNYYFNSCGVYTGIGLAYKFISLNSDKKNLFCFTPEVGYVHYLNGTLAIESAVFYDWSISNPSKYNKLGFKIGLGFYF